MIGYAALFWQADDDRARDDAGDLAIALVHIGWHVAAKGSGVTVLLREPRHQTVVHLIGDTVLIGHVFDRAETSNGRVGPLRHPVAVAPFDAKCQYWCGRGWGAYVAICRETPVPDEIELFRDPMGMLDCVHWTHRGLQLVTSAPEALLAHVPPSVFAIDWQRVARLLQDPGSAGDALPVIGVDQIPPGYRVRVSGPNRDAFRLWSPASFARRKPHADAADALPGLVDACVAAWCSTSQNAVGELSGGLDSAIVASAVARLPEAPIRRWFNYHSVDAASDERRYARAVAEHLGLILETAQRDHGVVDEALVTDMPFALRPPIGSLGLFHDTQLALKGRALGADMLLTGQGGDALFFQSASPLIAAGLPLGPRHWKTTGSALRGLALWGDRTLWPGLGALLRFRMGVDASALPIAGNALIDSSSLVSSANSDVDRWMPDVADLLPAKRMQLHELAAARAAFGASWCASAMRVVHPLLSQPLVEHVLPIPVVELTQARRDRALAREAWRDRLPDTVIKRRGKGSISAFLGRMLADSLPFLRSYLMGGILVSNGIVNRRRLDAWLHADHLMRINCYTEILFVLVMEHWARGWTDRFSDTRHGAGALPDGAAATR